MTIFLKQSTASQEVVLGRFLDSTDGNTEKTGLTIANTDIKIWVTGATTLASKNSGGGTHIANGVYYCVLDATDTATLGPMEVHTHVATALATKLTCVVLTANVYDSLIGGSSSLTVALAAQGKADVNAEVVDALSVDTYAEPGQGAPAANASIAAKINYLFKAWRNKKTQTSTTFSLFADDTTTVDQKATVSDDGTTFTSGEVATGP
jgi:hypothetical protein